MENIRGKNKYYLKLHKEILRWQGHLFLLIDKYIIKSNGLIQKGKIRINIRQNIIYNSSSIYIYHFIQLYKFINYIQVISSNI